MIRMSLRGWKYIAAAVLVSGLAFLCTLAAGLYLSGPLLPSFEEVRASYRLSDALLLDRHGRVIHEMRVDPTGRRLEWVALTDISPALTRAVVAAEDRRFHDHAGVDWQALGASLVRHVASGGSRGASTIAMQLASRLDQTATPRGARRTLKEKLRQISAALALERAWSKDEILEAYLNLITFRGELQGIAAASRGLFDKDPSGLGETESLILASLIPSSRTTAEPWRAGPCVLPSVRDRRRPPKRSKRSPLRRSDIPIGSVPRWRSPPTWRGCCCGAKASGADAPSTGSTRSSPSRPSITSSHS